MGMLARAAVLSAAAVAVGAATQGLPDLSHQLDSFLLCRHLFISRPQQTEGRPLTRFASSPVCWRFLIGIAQVQTNAVFWPLVAARAASITIMLATTLIGQKLALPAQSVLPLILLTGAMDAGGNAFFVLAEQAGRLDVAATLASLYPATTVILALSVLKERLVWWQSLGVLLALISVPLIAR